MLCEKNTVIKRTEVQQNTYRERAYTYLRIYTLKYKNACIVYYVAVFLGYQVKKRKKKKLYKTFVEIFFSQMPIMYKVILDTVGVALHFGRKGMM